MQLRGPRSSKEGKGFEMKLWAVLEERLEIQKKRYEDLVKTELPAFNALLKERNIPGIH